MAPRYAPVVIWEPFVLALVLGLIVSGGLYYAYLWPSVEPLEPDEDAKPADAKPADAKPADAKPADAKPADAAVETEEPAAS
jgi:hypothetical protein